MKVIKLNAGMPVSYSSCGHFLSTQPWTHMKRILDNYELIIGLKGILYIRLQNERYEVKPGEVLLLKPGQMHEGYRQTNYYNEVAFYWVHFQCESGYKEADLDAVIEKISLAKTNPYYEGLHDTIILPEYMVPNSIARINILFKQLLDISNSNYYTNRICDNLLTTLLYEISQQTMDLLFSNTKGTEDIAFSKVLEWIKINLNRKISLEAVAEAFRFNKKYFARLFKAKIGVTVNQYILTLKLHKAKDLLLQTELSIKEIAFLLGFNDEKYFMKVFRVQEQMTPTEFRKAYGKTHMNDK